MRSLARSYAGALMIDSLWLGGVALLLCVYLFYAMLAPEKF
jgi:K+-transporting ATPase KdpF subunit